MFFSRDLAETVAFNRPRENCLRPAFGGLGAVEGRKDGRHVVPVNHFRGETFRREFLAVNFHVMLVHRRIALPEGIHVSDDRQIVEFVMAGKLRGFPDLALRHFAIAQQDVNASRAFVQPRADGKARANRKPLAERARGGVDARNPRCGMAFEFAGKLPQRHQARFWENARFGERGI